MHIAVSVLKGLALISTIVWVCFNSTTALSSSSTVDVQQQLALPDTPPDARLPDGIRPTHYQLHLNIDPRKSHFSGTADITIALDGSTRFIWMHAKEMDFSSISIVIATGEELTLTWQQASPNGVIKLLAPKTIPAGTATLKFNYQAPFNTNLEGLHTVTKGDDSYAYTQFEATAARLAFPSFDEPAFKVSFDIKLTVPAAFSAITNTPQVSEHAAPDKQKTLTFATTKPLPTYLIAFAVGPFDIVEWQNIAPNALRKETIPLRGITTRGKGQEIHFALERTAAIVHAMEAYFDTPYPYAKLDIIAVPDFSAGAMENAGAITYREQLILLDGNAPISQQRAFYATHAHELAHQWFGNLVTPVWWDDIWLNESFATWNSYIILDQLFPGENYRDTLHNRASRVMRIDSLASARQIREPIDRHESIASAFNGITYQKGGGVLLMFEAFLGRENFRAGIRHYMKIYAFGNTTAEDFIDAIATANPQVDPVDLRDSFNSFIEQPGLPVINASMSCDSGKTSFTLKQQRYLPTGSKGESGQHWVIPTCLKTLAGANGIEQCQLLKGREMTIPATQSGCTDALMPNANGTAYYRFSMPEDAWSNLLGSLGQMTTGEQISIANSLSGELNAGNITLAQYYDAVDRLSQSSSWRVATAPRADLTKILDHIARDSELDLLRSNILRWYGPKFEQLRAMPQRDADQEQFHAVLFSILALDAQDPQLRSNLVTLAKAYSGMGSDEKIHSDAINPNLRLLALTVAVQDLGTDFSALLWRHFQNADNAQLRQHLLLAMSASKDSEFSAQMRERIFSPQLKDNEIYYIFHGQSTTPENLNALWTWSVSNLQTVLDRIPAWRQGQFPAMFDDFCSREKAQEVERAFEDVIDSLEAGPRYLANTVESIELCAAFVSRHTHSSQAQ
ncbi:MAG: M1 family metallopeptidase [Halioglobus sp.]